MGKHNKSKNYKPEKSHDRQMNHGGIEKKIKHEKEPKLNLPSAADAASSASKANPLSRTSSTTRAHLTSAKFSSLSLSAPTARAVTEVLCYESMTLVQEATLPVAMQGHDIIAKAKTGTGKTIGFLLPTIERIVRTGGGQGAILALAISPTRELASQIRAECEQLITFHKPQLSSLVVFGGTDVKKDVGKLRSSPPSILVGTPGRRNPARARDAGQGRHPRDDRDFRGPNLRSGARRAAAAPG